MASCMLISLETLQDLSHTHIDYITPYKVLAAPPIITSLTWRVDKETDHDPVV